MHLGKGWREALPQSGVGRTERGWARWGQASAMRQQQVRSGLRARFQSSRRQTAGRVGS